jgi:hypothetical protein
MYSCYYFTDVLLTDVAALVSGEISLGVRPAAATTVD